MAGVNSTGGSLASTTAGGTLISGVFTHSSGTFTVNSGATLSSTSTSVSAGTLFVNGALGNAAVTVTGGTLGGTGTIGGTVGVSGAGTLSAGASIGSLQTGALTMGSGTTFVFEADKADAGIADLVAVNGALSLTGVTLDLTNAALASGLWAANDKITLISYFDGSGGITSGFTGYDDGQSYTFGSNSWLFDYNDTDYGSNFTGDLGSANRFVTLTVVPEPGVVLLGGLGALVLLRRRRA